METTLDFVQRARHAFQELRHPGQADHAAQHQHDEEAGDNRRRSSTYPVERVDPTRQLNEFRILIGIHQDKSFAAPKGFTRNRRPEPGLLLSHRAAPNVGIYPTVCDAEIKCKRSYKGASRLINSCLGLQIIVAAALTALGAANGSRSAVTVFGAINTVIAGFLTYLKGSGLPNRFKYFQHEWGKIREYIEQRERDFALNLPGWNVYEEVDKIRRMYETVKVEIENNTPDRFVGVTQKTAGHSLAQHPPPGLAKPPRSMSTDSLGKRWLNEKETEMNTTMNRAQDKAQHGVSGVLGKIGHLKDVLEDKAKDVVHMEKELETNGHRMAEEKKHGIMGQIQDTIKEVTHLGKEIESKAKAAAEEQRHGAEDAFNRTAGTARGMTDGFAQNVADRQHDAENAFNRTADTARGAAGGFAQNVADRQHDAQNALNRTADTARGTASGLAQNVADRQHDAQDALYRTTDAARGAAGGLAQNVADRQHDVEAELAVSAAAARGVEQAAIDHANAAVAQTSDAIAQQHNALHNAAEQSSTAANRALAEQQAIARDTVGRSEHEPPIPPQH